MDNPANRLPPFRLPPPDQDPVREVSLAAGSKRSPSVPRSARAGAVRHSWVPFLFPGRPPYPHNNGKGRYYPTIAVNDPEGNEIRLTLGQITIAIEDCLDRYLSGRKRQPRGCPVRYLDGDPTNCHPANLKRSDKPDGTRRRHYHASRLVEMRFRAVLNGDDPDQGVRCPRGRKLRGGTR